VFDFVPFSVWDFGMIDIAFACYPLGWGFWHDRYCICLLSLGDFDMIDTAFACFPLGILT